MTLPAPALEGAAGVTSGRGGRARAGARLGARARRGLPDASSGGGAARPSCRSAGRWQVGARAARQPSLDRRIRPRPRRLGPLRRRPRARAAVARADGRGERHRPARPAHGDRARRRFPRAARRIGAVLATLGLMALAVSVGRSGATTSRAPSQRRSGALAVLALLVAACALQSGARRALGGLAAGVLLRPRRHHQASRCCSRFPITPAPTRCSPRRSCTRLRARTGSASSLLQRAFQHGGAIASLGADDRGGEPRCRWRPACSCWASTCRRARPPSALRLAAFAAAAGGAWALASRGAAATAPARQRARRADSSASLSAAAR